MVTPVKFTREVRFESIPEDQFRAYLTFIVKARDGALSLRVALSKSLHGEVSPVDRMSSTAQGVHSGWTLNLHMRRKTKDWWLESQNCDILSEGYCFGDTGYTAAKDAWRAFMEGEERGWKFLEDTYNSWRKSE